MEVKKEEEEEEGEVSTAGSFRTNPKDPRAAWNRLRGL